MLALWASRQPLPSSVNSTPNATTNNIADFTNGTGQVTSASNNQVVVTDLSTGQPLTLATTANTTFTGFNTSATCTTANTFACVQQGQIVNFNFGISGASGSGPRLQSLNLNSGITNGVTGTVIGVNPGTNQLQVLVTNESPAFASGKPGWRSDKWSKSIRPPAQHFPPKPTAALCRPA